MAARVGRVSKEIWIPVLVTVIVSALCISGWAHLLSERRTQVREVADLTAAQSQRAIATGVREYIVALHNLAELAAATGLRPPAQWTTNAHGLIESFPALVGVAWIDRDGHRHRVATRAAEPSREGDSGEPIEAPIEARTARLVGPLRDENGTIGFSALLPVRRNGADLGVLEARVDARQLLADVLQNWAPGYAIEVKWGDVDLYRRGEPSADPDLAWWTIDAPVPLPLEAAWTVILAPTAELAGAWLSPDSHYVLVLGIVLAIALGMLTHQLGVSFGHARALAEGNRSLVASASELRGLNELLEARVAERTAELETWAHSFSHDLKSPLGAIMNFSAILYEDHRGALDEEGLDALARIRRSATRAATLLDGLLRLDRARRASLDVKEIDMGELARQAFAQAQASLGDRDVELALEALPAAQGDHFLVADVLVNLFDNAIKFSRGREKRRVMMRGSRSGAECAYEISDNGQGFDMQYADKLFGVFERLHVQPDIPGTGVGLALVKKIVQRHGGRVWGEGEVDRGARFTFTLPYRVTS
jgi:two-component system sensor kinase